MTVYVVQFDDSMSKQHGAVWYFNGGANFPAGIYEINCSGWYCFWSPAVDPPGCSDSDGTDHRKIWAWCSPNPRISRGPGGMHIIYGGIDSHVSDVRVGPGKLRINHPGGPIGMMIYDEYPGDNTATARYELGLAEGVVAGTVHHPDPDNTPLFNARVTVTMYYKHSDGDIKYLYQYPSVYTGSDGYFEVNVENNPFALLSRDYTEFLLYGGWNRIAVKVDACNNQEVCRSDLIFNKYAEVAIVMHHHHTLKLIFKDSGTGAFLDNVKASLYDGFETFPDKDSGGGVSVYWPDAHPLVQTSHVTKEGYRLRSPIIDHRGIDVSNDCYKEVEVLLDRLVTEAMISFDKTRYLPEEVMVISYNTMFVPDAKIKLYDSSNTLIFTYLCNGYTQSTPEVRFALSGSVKYGIWAAVLEDASGSELAHATASVGTQGDLGYDTSMRCTEKKIKISWQGIDPVFKAGLPPNNMKVQIYDGAGILRGETNAGSAAGFWYYSITGAENYDAQWKALLIDQWGYTVDSVSMTVFRECTQAVFGHVQRRDGTPVEGVTITMDLTFMGYGVKTAVTGAGGLYTLTGLPPILPTTDITASKDGFKSEAVQVTLEPGQIKEVDFVLEGLIKGTVKDIEGTRINAPSIFRTGGSDYVFAVYHEGIYDLECPPGTVTLKCAKKNFQDYEVALAVATSQIMHNITLLRPVPDVKLIAVETAEASLDDSDSNAIFNSSGQDTVLVDQKVVETPHAYTPWGSYQIAMHESKKYFAGYTANSFISSYQKMSTLESHRLHTVLMDASEKWAVYLGSSLTLKGGYVLRAKDIDTTARTVRFSLLYYGDEVDDAVVSSGQTYIYHSAESALAGLPVVAAHVSDVLSGREAGAAFVDGVFQISEYYTAFDGQIAPSEKYVLRSGSRDATGAYQIDASSSIEIQKS